MVGVSPIVGTPTSANPVAQNIRHVILIDFGAIDEPALPLHSALALIKALFTNVFIGGLSLLCRWFVAFLSLVFSSGEQNK